jgi:hypothetical protein
VVQIAPQRAAFRAQAVSLRIHPNASHQGEIERQSPVANGVAGDVVAASSHRKHETALADKFDRLDDIGDARSSHDQRGAFVDHTVPDPPRLVIVAVPRAEQLAAQSLRECRDLGCGEHGVSRWLLICD